MFDIAATLLIVGVFAGITGVRALRAPRLVRPWFWLALVEYLLCALLQFHYAPIASGDALGYRRTGTELAKMLSASFRWAAPELLSLLLQQPSAFDVAVFGAGTNTGSMHAASGMLIFCVGGSPYAAQALVTGLAMLGAFATYEAFRDAHRETPPIHLFAATVLFPSVAFWTSALHKEAFCMMGVGLALAGWRAASKRNLRAIVYGPLGVGVVVVFRPHVLPPLLLGLVFHLTASRIRKARREERGIVRPVYITVGVALLALGASVVRIVAPNFGVERITETVSERQAQWAALGEAGGAGGSAFQLEQTVTRSPGAQLALAPLSLLNALFRPQLFDVTNPFVLVSALEMTGITWLVIRVFRRHGVRGVVARIQKSPFLLMCSVVAVIGCTFVGLTTRNFGTLARYRVPFLPFYGALLAGLGPRTAVTAPQAPPAGPRRTIASGRRTRTVAAKK